MISGSRVFNAAKNERVDTKNEERGLTLNWNYELGDDWQNFWATFLKHIESALNREETVRLLFFANALKENGQVVMVVQLHNVNFPEDPVLWTVLNSDRQVTTIVETSEFAAWNRSRLDGACFGLLCCWSRLRGQRRCAFAASSFTLQEGSYQKIDYQTKETYCGRRRDFIRPNRFLGLVAGLTY